jgi:NADH-quinone oxidoreductase subunit D
VLFPALKRRAIVKRPSGAGKIRFSTEIAATQQIETERKRLTTNDRRPTTNDRFMTDSNALSPSLETHVAEHDETFLDANELVINMGPQHPATHGVLRVILRLDGEKVLGLECVIGYLHRGVEKIAENRTYTMFNPYVDRMDYVAAVSNGLGYCEAVEKLLSVEAPSRAQYIRVILTELNRMASHQLWLGTHALDIGAITPLFYTFRDREEILKIFEKYCGARLTTHAFRIGGLQYEAYEGFEKDVRDFVKFVRPKIDEYEELLTTNRIWVERTRGVGVISAKDAIALGVTGPVLRASGVKWDLRKAQPYANYKNFDFEIPVGVSGDTYDRYIVRMAEFRQSLRIIEQAVEGIPEGPIMAKVPKVMKPPVGEVYHSIEAPKGELGYFIVSDGSTQPYRVRVRPPSFVNLQALDMMCRGQLVADVIAVIGTLDIVLGEVDR